MCVMGQVALGFRSLLFKIAIFVVMASLLAWALGGTLFPRPVTAIQTPTVQAGGSVWAWQVTIEPQRHELVWHLVRQHEEGWAHVPGGGPFDTVQPLTLSDASSASGDVLFHVHASKRGAGLVALEVRADGTVSPPSPVTATVD